MSKKETITTKTAKLILSGNAAKDFDIYLKSDQTDYDFGLSLIERYTVNRTLLNFLKSKKGDENALEVLNRNINVIARKWSK